MTAAVRLLLVTNDGSGSIGDYVMGGKAKIWSGPEGSPLEKGTHLFSWKINLSHIRLVGYAG